MHFFQKLELVFTVPARFNEQVLFFCVFLLLVGIMNIILGNINRI